MNVPARRGARLATWLVLLVLLAALGWRGWLWWQSRGTAANDASRTQTEQWRAVDARIDALRRDQRAQSQRIAQADTGTRVLREEVLGIGQRTALLQDSVDQLAAPARESVRALRLDEIELLLVQGAQRLQLAGDLEGATRAYALAAGVLDGIQDPGLLDLRQALAQEREALVALGDDPRVAALVRLDAFAQALSPPPVRSQRTVADGGQAWWRRALGRLVQVRRSDPGLALEPGGRAAAYAALQLELTLARSAAERRDERAWRSALQRADAWIARAWPSSRASDARRAELAQLATAPLRPDLPAMGSTLRMLQAQRSGR